MTYIPTRTDIVGITNSDPAIVTTSPDHGMFTGMVARLVVPQNYGMTQLNGILAHVRVISPSTFACYSSLVPFSVSINTLNFPVFVVPTSPGLLASCIPVGDGPTPETAVAWQVNNNFADSPLDDTFLNNSTVEIPF